MKPKLSTSATVPGGQGGAIPLGTDVGDTLGFNVGTAVSATVGDALGFNVGTAVSATVGDALGFKVGTAVSATVGDAVSSDGANVGFAAGSHPDRAALRT